MASPESNIWPDGCLGAVSISFDDGRPSQLERAVPVLDEKGLRATFYLPMRGENWREGYAPWVDVAANGHEIGNHTKSHTCSRNFSFRKDGTGLEEMTLEEIEADILEAEDMLRELVPSQTERTFCYPCYQTFVGEGATRQSYVPIVAKHFVAARSTGEVGWFNNPLKIDLHCLNCASYGHLSGIELIGQVERAFQKRQWIILTYHGIDAGKPAQEFVEMCNHLAERQGRIWTAPVVDVARHVRDFRASTMDTPE